MGLEASRRKDIAPSSLLERLRADDEGLRLDQGDRVADRIASIKRNVVKILNTRVGGAMSAAELGLDDFNDSAMESTDMLISVARDISRCLTRFEPRISNVVVEYERVRNRGISLHFNIRADFHIGRERDRVAVDVALLDGRHFILR